MMKRMLAMLLAVSVFWIGGIPVSASYHADTVQELYEESGMEQATDILDESTQKLLQGLGLDPKTAAKWSEADLIEFWNLFAEQCRLKCKEPIQLLAALIGVMLLSVLMQMLKAGDAVTVPLDLFYTVSCAAVLGQPMVRLIGQAKAVFETAGAFMESFLPAYAGVFALLGKSNAAFGMQTVVFATAQVVTKLMSEIMLPVLSVYLALCFVSGAGDLIRTDQIVSAVSQSASWVLGLVMSFFTLTLSLQRMIAQAADTLGLKTAKLAVSTFVPVVGGQLSDALSSVTVCLRMLGSTAGSFSIAVLAVLFLPLLLSVLAMLLLCKICQIAAALFHLDAAVRMFAALSGGTGLLFGVILCAAAAMIIAMALLASAVGG